MTNNTADLGFEKKIWDAACILRGNMDAAEYKHIILGLIFLKYISDKFIIKYQSLASEAEGFEEDIDEYRAERISFSCHKRPDGALLQKTPIRRRLEK